MDYYVLLWISTNYFELLRITSIYFDYSDLLRITPDYFGLLRIISDYQFRSPSGPADYQNCFPLGITADYAVLLRFTLIATIYSELVRFTSNYFGLHRSTQITWIFLDYYDSPRITTIHSGLLRFTPDYYELLRINPDYLDYFGLLRFTLITPIYFGLLRIISDYQFGSPSGPADYQNCFPLGITTDYAVLLRFTLIATIYSELVRFTSNYFGLHRSTQITWIFLDYYDSPRITTNYFALTLITWITWITSIYFHYSDLRRITLDYFGLPVRITKWSSGLPKLFLPRDYYRLSRITSDYSVLLRITSYLLHITSNYFELLRYTSCDYLGLLVRIPKWSSGLPELFPPRDYSGLFRNTPNYSGYSDLIGLRQITPIYFRLSRNMQITPIYLDYGGLLRFTTDYCGYFGLPIRITKWSSGLADLFPPRQIVKSCLFRGQIHVKDKYWFY